MTTIEWDNERKLWIAELDDGERVTHPDKETLEQFLDCFASEREEVLQQAEDAVDWERDKWRGAW